MLRLGLESIDALDAVFNWVLLVAVLEPVVEVVTELLEDVHVVGHVSRLEQMA